jgi:hypothetical protein
MNGEKMATIKAATQSTDFNFESHGSICLLRPLTPAAIEWVNGQIGQDNGFQPYWPTVVIEPRYCETILRGIAADGLGVE